MATSKAFNPLKNHPYQMSRSALLAASSYVTRNNPTVRLQKENLLHSCLFVTEWKRRQYNLRKCERDKSSGSNRLPSVRLTNASPSMLVRISNLSVLWLVELRKWFSRWPLFPLFLDFFWPLLCQVSSQVKSYILISHYY